MGSPEDMVMRKEEADIGRCGEFRRPISVEELVERLSEGLGIRPESIRIATGDREGADGSELRFHKAGLCTGAGADLLPMAQKLGCDVFVTGDVKYHKLRRLQRMGSALSMLVITGQKSCLERRCSLY